MKQICILGVHITERVKDASEFQAILTKFGCSIKTRLGLHEVNGEFCSPSGLIILELSGDPEECHKLEIELMKIQGLEVKKMVFTE